MRKNQLKAASQNESKRLTEERRAFIDLLDQKGPNGIKYSQATRKMKLTQKVIQNFGQAKVRKKLTVTVIKALIKDIEIRKLVD